MHNGASTIFEPDELSLIGSAFDRAWAMLLPDFQRADEDAQLEARSRLAGIMIRLAKDALDGDELQRRAIAVFRQS